MYNVNIIRDFLFFFRQRYPSLIHTVNTMWKYFFTAAHSSSGSVSGTGSVFLCAQYRFSLSLSFARTSIYCCANEMYFVSLVLAAHGTIQCRLMRAWNTHAIHLAAAATDVTDSRWCRAIFTACRLVYFIEWIANENTNRTHTQATTNGAKSSLVQQQPTTSGLELAH